MTRDAEIIAVGSELLTPSRVDTNSLWLTRQLNELGIQVRLKTIVGDDAARLEEALSDALKRSQVVITTGGLGPTEDDITRQIAAKTIGRPLRLDGNIEQELKAKFESRGIRMPDINLRQAMVPEGAIVLPNHKGTAPGLLVEQDGRILVLLPGPPRELMPMYLDSVAGRLSAVSGGMVLRRMELRAAGLGESALDELIHPVYSQYRNPSTTILFSEEGLEVHLTAEASTIEEADALLDEVATKIEERAGEFIYSRKGETLAEVVARLLTDKGLTLATAESCTGGLIAKMITDIPGSSKFFLEGFVTYSNEAKIVRLDLDSGLIERYGAVSEEVACAMAEGVRKISGASIGIGVTGIAGPDGGTPEKPVGLVYLAYSDASHTEHKRRIFGPDRARVRSLTALTVFDLIRRRVS